MAQIWIVKPSQPVEIWTGFGNVATTGQFGLKAVSLMGGPTDLTRLTPADGLGDARFRVTPSENLSFSLAVVCTGAPGGSGDAHVEVRQDGDVAPCLNAGGKVVNADGGGFKAMKMGGVAVGTVKAFNFQVLR